MRFMVVILMVGMRGGRLLRQFNAGVQ